MQPIQSYQSQSWTHPLAINIQPFRPTLCYDSSPLDEGAWGCTRVRYYSIQWSIVQYLWIPLRREKTKDQNDKTFSNSFLWSWSRHHVSWAAEMARSPSLFKGRGRKERTTTTTTVHMPSRSRLRRKLWCIDEGYEVIVRKCSPLIDCTSNWSVLCCEWDQPARYTAVVTISILIQCLGRLIDLILYRKIGRCYCIL